ncbi:MAG: bifunctional phosphopantothenoylcysteine decarboxylase/phosphopantothenate--cysteine ligase CoaBC [Actinomycetes bacterium]
MASIVLGVAGGIAAYKSCELLRLLSEAGHSVRVVPTPAALRFVGAATWEALSGQPVTTEVWERVPAVEHVGLGQGADLVVVAPATADLLARAAAGLGDDLLTAVLLTARCPVVMAPAMHTEMWQHPATVANVATLRARGVQVVEPAAGRLTGADSGPGRLPEPSDLAAVCAAVLDRAAQPRDMSGRTVVVSAGGTREPIDPVRFLGNRSSGRQGLALAEAAADRGAAVVLVAANVELPSPPGVQVVPVSTAAELRQAVHDAAAGADAVVMAAAVADFRPTAQAASKIKKDDGPVPSIDLERTTDVLGELVAHRLVGQVVVGFAAETGDESHSWAELGQAKLARKGCDLLVVNEVGDGLAFGTADNAALLLGSDGSRTEIPLGPKRVLADRVWDAVVSRWPDR